MSDLNLSLDYLYSQSFLSLLSLFWFVIIFDFPRYVILFGVTSILPAKRYLGDYSGKVSVIIAGHSEADAVERCVLALHEQSRVPDEIIVISDGSGDDMRARIRTLARRGLVSCAHATELRSGKSAGVNMASSYCTGDIVVNVDCDCTFDRHAIKNILMPFEDQTVAAVCGSLRPRNAQFNLITRFQSIEYLVSISLGREAADRIDQVACVSGAFGAFRRDAFFAQGGLDAGGGEDLDVTLRLRQAGWSIRFAKDAVCYTDVPDKLQSFVRQRLRWERDAIRLRYRKHIGMMNPFNARFRLSELINELEFLVSNVLSSIAMPIYFVWLIETYGSLALPILFAAQAGLLCLDLLILVLALSFSPAENNARLVAYAPGYSIFNGIFMRLVRLVAYGEEWIFRKSYTDEYVPNKVHRVRG